MYSTLEDCHVLMKKLGCFSREASRDNIRLGRLLNPTKLNSPPMPLSAHVQSAGRREACPANTKLWWKCEFIKQAHANGCLDLSVVVSFILDSFTIDQ